MIHSAIEDNWMRVVTMHSVAHKYYESTRETEFRQRIMERGDIFPFNAQLYDGMDRESCIVSMVMAWSVITIESLVNHAIVETLNNRICAVMAIEYPGQVADKFKVAKCARSALSKKLFILHDGSNEGQLRIIMELADKLSDIRNGIIHDKPFSLIYYDDDEELNQFALRGTLSSIYRYDDLPGFYKDCDELVNYILSRTDPEIASWMSYSSLINI